METKEATAIVVQMAKDRAEDSPEGEALRKILAELRERRIFESDVAMYVDEMTEMIDDAVAS